MKTLFGYKIEKGKAELTNVSEFVKKSVPEDQRKSIDEIICKFETVKNPKIPKWLEIPMSICSLITIIGLLTFERSNLSVSEAFGIYPVISTVVVAFLIAFVAILVYIFIKQKLFYKNDEYLRVKAAKERLQKLSYENMGVPDTAESVDAFLVQYEIKNADVKLVGMSNILNYKMYVENEELHLATDIAVLAIPLEFVNGITKIKKKMQFGKWEREDNYRKLGVKKNKYYYYVAEFYALKINHNGEEYALYFPPYELETIEKLTGLKAE